jgi:hypothetical protein
MNEPPPALTQEQINAMSLEEARRALAWISRAHHRGVDDATAARVKQEFKWLLERLKALQE